MSSNLPLIRWSCRVLPWLGGGLKLEINIPSQQIRAKRKGGLINEGGIILSEYGSMKKMLECSVLARYTCHATDYNTVLFLCVLRMRSWNSSPG